MKKVERGELRLTGGDRRGAKLYAVTGRDLRPALARLRKSLFDMLGPRVEGATVVDLFAGTGSLALEALSRGAAHAVLFETDRDCADAIRKNLGRLRYEDRATLLEESAFEAPWRLPLLDRRADVVFVDPPYALYRERERWAALQEAIAALPFGEDPVVVVEHRSGFPVPDFVGKLASARRRKYGGTSLAFYAWNEKTWFRT